MRPPTVRFVSRVALVVLLAGYFVLLLANACFFAAGPDSSGYLNEARLLAGGDVAAGIGPLRELGWGDEWAHLFTPVGFAKGVSPATMVPTYPVGTAVHLAVAGMIGGWGLAPFLVSPIAAVACVVLMFLLGREMGLSFGWSVMAAIILAGVPVFISHALQPVSDVLATFWAVLAILAGCRSRHSGRGAWWAAGAGIAFAIGVCVRPTNLLLGLPLAIAIGANVRRLLVGALAAAPIGAALLWYHNALYGSPFRTGYGVPREVMSWDVFRTCFSFHVTSLASMVTPLVVPGGLLVVFARSLEPWRRSLLVSWFAIFFLFYSVYVFCTGWSSSRFLLPAVPAAIIGALHLLRLLAERSSGTRAIAVVLALAIVATEVRQVGSLHVLKVKRSDSIFPETVRFAEEHVPEGALLLAGVVSGAYYYYTGRIPVRWDQLDPETSAMLANAPAAARAPWYAVVSEAEGGGDALRRRIPGRWTAVATHRDVTLWRLERAP